MRKLFLLLFFWHITSCAGAQTTEEWVRQKETAIKYLMEQILALKGYAHVLEEGYGIVQKGLALIHDVKGADFYQHQSYMQSLLQIAPALHHYAKTSGCFVLQAYLEKRGKDLIVLAHAEPGLQDKEKAYIRQVVEAMVNESKVLILALKMVLQMGAYGMQDNERLTRVNGIHADLQDKKVRLLSFIQQTGSLIAERNREDAGIRRLKKINTKE